MLYSFKTVSGESLSLNLDRLLSAYPANSESTITRVVCDSPNGKTICHDLDITYSNFFYLLGD